MRKTYRYKNIECEVSNNEEVNLTVEFISNGNSGITIINIPGDNDPEIEDEGTVLIGRGESLRAHPTVVFSTIMNPVQHEDEIKIRYKINGETILLHTNPRSEEEQPIIVLIITFSQP